MNKSHIPAHMVTAFASSVAEQMHAYSMMTGPERAVYYDRRAGECDERVLELRAKAVEPYWMAAHLTAIEYAEREAITNREAAAYYRDGGKTLQELMTTKDD